MTCTHTIPCGIRVCWAAMRPINQHPDPQAPVHLPQACQVAPGPREHPKPMAGPHQPCSSRSQACSQRSPCSSRRPCHSKCWVACQAQHLGPWHQACGPQEHQVPLVVPQGLPAWLRQVLAAQGPCLVVQGQPCRASCPQDPLAGQGLWDQAACQHREVRDAACVYMAARLRL